MSSRVEHLAFTHRLDYILCRIRVFKTAGFCCLQYFGLLCISGHVTVFSRRAAIFNQLHFFFHLHTVVEHLPAG